MKYLSYLLASVLLIAFASSAQALVVLADDFNDPNGTMLDGKMLDIGVNATGWIQNTIIGGSVAANPLRVRDGVVDTSEVLPPFSTIEDAGNLGARASFTNVGGNSNRTLVAGEVLTFSFTTELPDTGSFLHGFSGFFLQEASINVIFIGNTSLTPEPIWQVDDVIGGGSVTALTSIAGAAQDGVFTYEYTTGAYDFLLGGISRVSGTLVPELGLNRLQFTSGNVQASGFAVSDVEVDISPVSASALAAVPEPTSMVLAVMGLIGLVGWSARRRKR